MKRRDFVFVLGSAFAAPLVRAQQARVPYRIAMTSIAPRQDIEQFIAALEQGLRELGYAPGKDILIEVYSAEGKAERYPAVVQEMVRSRPDVILTGTNVTTNMVKEATQTIPIVMAFGTDVVAAGYARSLAKPGGNITGLTVDVGLGPFAKRLELLKEIAPRISRVAIYWESPYRQMLQAPLEAAAASLGMSIFWQEFSGHPQRDFAEMARLRAEAVQVAAAVAMYAQRKEIIAAATKHRLPTTFTSAEYVAEGGLMSYGPNIVRSFGATAKYVDRILKGARPGDVPIEQPARLDLTINLKTAKVLGLTIPRSLLNRFDRVIE